MTATIIRMPVPDACRFSTAETAVLWRLQEGAQIDTIASELGLAEPIVKEYIKSILRKVLPEGTHLSAAIGTDERAQSTLRNDDPPVLAPSSIGPSKLNGRTTASCILSRAQICYGGRD
jgi:hypothetical protein